MAQCRHGKSTLRCAPVTSCLHYSRAFKETKVVQSTLGSRFASIFNSIHLRAFQICFFVEHSECMNIVYVIPELHFQVMTFCSKLGRLDHLSIHSKLQPIQSHVHVLYMHTLKCKNMYTCPTTDSDFKTMHFQNKQV